MDHGFVDELIAKAKNDGTSLAVFKPTKVLNFKVEEVERNWDPNTLGALNALSRQLSFFKTPEEIEEEYKVVPKKVPYKFSYEFEDDDGRSSTLMIADWEIGMLYFNCLEQANDDEDIAIEKVKQKYFDYFLTRDLHFFLGTVKEYHNISQNPFIIVGVYYPPIPPPFEQMSFF